MQLFGLHKSFYKLSSYAIREKNKSKVRSIYEKPVKQWDKLKAEGVSDKVISEFLGISRASYYRYRRILHNLRKNIYPTSKAPKHKRSSQIDENIRQLILMIRRENPTYGKNKIYIILAREHSIKLSESSVGRVIKNFQDRGLIQKSISAPRMRRRRRFKGHAKAWEYNMKATKPGEMIQIDHMSVSKNQLSIKHFQAWDPKSKFIFADVFSRASSSVAKTFLHAFIKQAPFKITSIQVDGGSEFMKEFEEECFKLGIKLFVLPPKRPQYNGGVERGNRIFREEFYERKDLIADSIGAMSFDLKISIKKYNNFRPHFNLKGLTPMQYIQQNLEAA